MSPRETLLTTLFGTNDVRFCRQCGTAATAPVTVSTCACDADDLAHWSELSPAKRWQARYDFIRRSR